jgi:hypothetical protein
MFRKVLKFFACCLIAGALILLAKASEMPLKAIVGQHLLNDVWEKTLYSGIKTKPWESADFEVVGELKVPRLGLSRIVLNSVSGEAMAWGVGTLDPDVSKQSPIILAGHRDTHMEFMSQLHVGDRMSFQLADGSLKSYEDRKINCVKYSRASTHRSAQRSAPIDPHDMLAIQRNPFGTGEIRSDRSRDHLTT